MKNLKKNLTVILLSATSLTALVGCGVSSKSMDTASWENCAPASEAPCFEETFDAEMYDLQSESFDERSAMGQSSFNSNNSTVDQRKLIVNVGLDIETDEFDKFVDSVNQALVKSGGYIEYEYSNNGSAYASNPGLRNSTLTIRVPNDRLDEFVNDLSGIGHITNKTKSTQDVTLQYVDTESKKEMYLAEQESLLALLEKADTIEDITYLTERIAQVRYEIESMESTLRVYDDLVDYATINLNVSEVVVYSAPEVTTVQEKTVGEQIKEGFANSLNDVINGLENFFVNFVVRLPYLIRTLVILGIIGGAIFGIIKLIIFFINRSRRKAVAMAVKLNANRVDETIADNMEKTLDSKENK